MTLMRGCLVRFIDSNVIAYSFYNNEFKDRSRNILRGEGITNSIALIEAFNIIEKQTDRETAIGAIKSILKSNLEIYPISVNTVFEAMRTALQHKQLQFLDLAHFATAQIHGCTEIVTYDKDFEGLAIQRTEP